MIIFFVADSANSSWTLAMFWIKFDVFGKGMKCTGDILQFINMTQGLPNITTTHVVSRNCLVSTTIFTANKTWMLWKNFLNWLSFN